MNALCCKGGTAFAAHFHNPLFRVDLRGKMGIITSYKEKRSKRSDTKLH